MDKERASQEAIGVLEDGLFFRKRSLSIRGYFLLVALVVIPVAWLIFSIIVLARDQRGIFAVGPPLPLDLDIQERQSLLLISYILFNAVILVYIASYFLCFGRLAWGIRVHDNAFQVLRKDGTAVANIPAGDIGRIIVVKNALSEGKAFRITLHERVGRSYTLRNSMDGPLFAHLAELCGHECIEFEYRKDVIEPLALGLSAMPFAAMFAVAFPRHPFPVVVSAVCVVALAQVVCHKIVVRNMK